MRSHISRTLTSGDLRADRRYAYAQGCLDDGDPDGAAEMAEQALEIAPRFAPAWFLLGRAREALSERSGDADAQRGALRAYATALEIDPDDAQGARLALARFGAGSAASAVSPGYVRALFDAYAPRFDRHLVEGLRYRGHEQVAAALRGAGPGSLGRVIDLGCGTGLVGATLGDRPEHLTGIDLSPEMLARAERRGCYHRLVPGELVAALADEPPASADCVTAADVMIYVGDFSGVLAATARVLRPGGHFAFTVQTHPGDGLILGADARYAHGDALVRTAVPPVGLTLEHFEPAAPRRENGCDVPGRVVGARKPGPSTR